MLAGGEGLHDVGADVAVGEEAVGGALAADPLRLEVARQSGEGVPLTKVLKWTISTFRIVFYRQAGRSTGLNKRKGIKFGGEISYRPNEVCASTGSSR